MTTKPDLSLLSYGARLTEAQHRAASSVERSVSVTAGAGAGKTGVLVARFISLLQTGVSPENIVAITFSRKATAEMSERLQSELQHMAMTDSRARQWLVDLPSVQISTLHALAGQILRRFALEAHIDPSFRILEPFESNQMLHTACKDALQRWEGLESDVAQLLYEDLSSADYLQALYLMITTLRNRGEDIDALVERQHSSDKVVPAFSAWSSQLNTYQKKIPSSASKVSGYCSELAMAFALLSTFTPDTADLGYTEDIAVLLGAAKNVRELHAETTMAASALVDFLDTLSQHGTFIEEFSLYIEKRFALFHRSVVHLLQDALQRFQLAKQQAGGLDYTDLELYAAALLTENPRVAKAMQQEWQYYLVDEFQDLNYGQYRLIKELCGSRLNEALFICGDPKQSIYRFRGAVVALFGQMSGEIGSAQGRDAQAVSIGLRDNFRTQSPLVDAVNVVFSHLMGNTYEPMLANRPALSITPRLEMLGFQGENAEAKRVDEAQQMAIRIQRIVSDGEMLVQTRGENGEELRPARYGDIALLFRSRTSADLYNTALQQQGIPTLQEGGRTFYQRPEVDALRVLMQLLIRPDDHLSLWKWLTGPLVRVNPWQLSTAYMSQPYGALGARDVNLDLLDEATALTLHRALEQIDRWRQWLASITLDQLVERIVDELWLAEAFALQEDGAQMLANVRKFQYIIADLQLRSAKSLEELIMLVDDLASIQDEGLFPLHDPDATDINAVRLLTVHATKGLEYPIVVLPDLMRQAPRYTAPKLIQCDELGFFLPIQLARARRAQEAEQFQEHQESIRVLYVALTRARDYILFAEDRSAKKRKPSAGSWWAFLEEPINELAAKGLVHESPRLEAKGNALGASGADEIIHVTAPTVDLSEVVLETQHRYTSVTALMSYQRCPRLYYMQSHLRLQPPYQHRVHNYDDMAIGYDDSSAAADDAMRFGTLVHKLCDFFSRDPTKLWTPIGLADIIAEFATSSSTNRFDLEYTEAELPELTERVIPMMQSFLTGNLMQHVRNGVAVYRELPFMYRIAQEQLVTGIIDLLVVNQDDTLSLYDYKTNQITDEYRSRLAEQYRLQMHIYARAAEQLLHLPLRNTHLYLFQAKQGEELLPIALDISNDTQTDGLLAQAAQAALAIATSWRVEHYPLASSEHLCGQCGYASLCGRG